jgi:hypothetical protein
MSLLETAQRTDDDGCISASICGCRRGWLPQGKGRGAGLGAISRGAWAGRGLGGVDGVDGWDDGKAVREHHGEQREREILQPAMPTSSRLRHRMARDGGPGTIG